MTNGDRLRNMSDEERAQFFQTLEYLYSIYPAPVSAPDSDQIKNMSDDELAERICYEERLVCPSCPAKDICDDYDNTASCKETIKWWLKEE